MIERIVVVLPMPLRPSSVTISPSPTSRSTSNSTWLRAVARLRACDASSIRRLPRRDRRRAPPRLSGSRRRVPVAIMLAIDQHRDAVGQREDRVHVVLDQQHRDFGPSAPQAGRSSAALSAVPSPAIGSSSSSRRGFVGERDRELELLLLAMRQFARRGRPRAAPRPTRSRCCGASSRNLAIAARIAQKRKLWPLSRLHGERDIVERA